MSNFWTRYRSGQSVTLDVVWGSGAVTLGEIDERAEWVFTHGQCHALALALHLATGWPLIEAGWHVDSVPNHWLVEAPDGRLVDITGAYDPSDVEEEWGSYWQGSEEDLWALVDGGDYRPPDVDAAASFVRPLLGRYAPHALAAVAS